MVTDVPDAGPEPDAIRLPLLPAWKLGSRRTTGKETIMKTAHVEAYLASVPADARAALRKLRQAVAAAAPGAEEGFSYGLPAFRLDGATPRVLRSIQRALQLLPHEPGRDHCTHG
jgi:hypothetical protein